MYFILLTAVLATLLLGTAIVLLLRTFLTTCLSYAETFDRMDLSWCDYRPFQRLLDPADFEFLRRRGVAPARIKKLRHERRQIYRLCLRSIARDFNQVHLALKLGLLQSDADRPELTEILARQKFRFYSNLLKAEAWMTLHACGWDRIPAPDLLRPLEIVREQLRQLAPAPQFAGSAV